MKTLTVSQALTVLNSGGIIAYPTETFYGLGGNPLNENVLEKIFSIKERDRGKPVSILIKNNEELLNWAQDISPLAKKLIQHFWPGPLTLVFKAKKSVSPILTAGSGTIAIRVSSHPVATMLCEAFGSITTTSANVSGAGSISSAKEVDEQIGERIEGVVTNETLPASLGSSFVDVTGTTPKLLRAGDITWESIQKYL
ncbi:threonylcarbamoyl-AMP synthase [bacterium]|nr:threonylcarbamoyl-AMP synthase [bacterium]